jgi:hypothetical protein
MALPPSVLKQGFTAKEREIFSKLLVDLFLAQPRKRAYRQHTNTEDVSETTSR